MADATTTTTTTTVPSTQVTLPPKSSPSTGGPKQEDEDVATYYQRRYDDAHTHLGGMLLAPRLALLELLRKKGFSSGVPVSATGMDPSDIARVRELMVYQDTLEKTTTDKLLPATVEQVKSWSDQATTSGSSKRTPDADLDAYLTAVMQQKLGRSPRPSELEKFRKGYAAMEAGGNEPTATVAAQEQIETANKAEYEASQFASFASAFESMLRSA